VITATGAIVTYLSLKRNDLKKRAMKRDYIRTIKSM
jgi:hypothetical protein